MTLEPFLLSVLADPVDHGELLYFADRSILYNARTHVAYDVRGSIPVMLPEEAHTVTESEHNELVSDSSAVRTGPAPSSE